MKVTKAEIIWAIVVILGYLFYNIPYFPKYGDMNMAIIHGVISLIWTWGANYIGFMVIKRIIQTKEEKENYNK